MNNGGCSNSAHPFDTWNWFASNDMSSLRVPLHGAGCINDHAERMKGATELTLTTREERVGEESYYRR